jgi:hypothetical protein
MRTLRLSGLALAAALIFAPFVGAQGPRVEITDVRVGFPGSINATNNRGAKNGRFKQGAWAPVYVDLEVREAPLTRDNYVLVVETTDSEDLQNVYVERRFLPTIEPKESPTLLTYVRPGNANSEITVRVLDARGQDVCKKKHLTLADINPMPPHVYGYLTLGGKTSSLYKALVSKQQQVGGAGKIGGLPAGPDAGEEGNDRDDPEENGNRSFAHIDQVQQMPTYWFGYQPVDTIVLLTSKQQFVTDLNPGGKDDPFSIRRDALAEWVRRGGHLIVSVSKNHQEVNQILEQMKIIDLTIEGRTQLPSLPGVAHWAGVAEFRGIAPKDQPKSPIIEVAKLKPGRGVQVLAADKADLTAPDVRPLIVQAACGLGRVIVVGFDIDEKPFTGWQGREDFWKRIKEINEPSNIGDGLRQDPRAGWRGNIDQNNGGELAGKLVRSLEAFPDVPVISFGWVALFILVYILIVGPLDYFFLKKVVKRLELTWITFPAVVIVISAVAYFAAYHLKGKDLRINKVDIVDVDLSGGNVYGSTWFTLFSPRIQNYTIGVEPGNGWGPEENDPKKYGPLVGWMGRPDDTLYGSRGSQSLFRRAYDYAPESSGLKGVPIQVWSTKTFNASWSRPIKEDELVEAKLEVAKNDPEKKMKLSGTITSHLPVDLRDVVLFYRGKFYPLDKLTAGSPLRIDGKMEQPGDPQIWFNQPLGQANFQAANRRGSFSQDPPQPIGSYIKSILFHTYPGDTSQQGVRNSGLRYLDEKWRLDVNYRDEAILFGRAEPLPGVNAEGKADEVSQSGLSGSKLWLGSLPGGKREEIKGTLSQDTYVRVYIPVNTSK